MPISFHCSCCRSIEWDNVVALYMYTNCAHEFVCMCCWENGHKGVVFTKMFYALMRRIKYVCSVPTWQRLLYIYLSRCLDFLTAQGSGVLHHDIVFWQKLKSQKICVAECMWNIESFVRLSVSDSLSFWQCLGYPTSFYTLGQINRCLMMIGGVGRT